MAFKTAALRESQPCWSLVLANDSPLHALSARYRYTDVAGFSHSSFKDGFLAVASLLASTILIVRAYEGFAGGSTILPGSFEELQNCIVPGLSSDTADEMFKNVAHCQTISVLHSANLFPVAVDLESRFVEAALGPLHISDFRNFGHGRHHWMAKRPHETGVFALVSQDERLLADRTVNLLPTEIPIARLEFHGDKILQSLAAMVAGLTFASYGGKVAGIDPAKPGVPLFGRRLYNLGPGSMRLAQSGFNRDAAVSKKTLNDRAKRSKWVERYVHVFKQLQSRNIAAVVLDYDGTICDQRNRYDPLPADMADALSHVHTIGLKLGIATGRGPSAGNELRKVLPPKMWKTTIIGYYNGGVVTTLDDDRDPIAEGLASEKLVAAISNSVDLKDLDVRHNEHQLSLKLRTGQSPVEAVEIARILLNELQMEADVLASGHSIDLVFNKASKLNVVEKVRDLVSESNGAIVRIGDKGSWPGNDAALLNDPFGLSVDEANSSPNTCWKIAPAGLLGPQATLYYLNALKRTKLGVRFQFKQGDRGVKYET